MIVRRFSVQQLLIALALCAVLVGGGALTLFLLDFQEKNAITADDLFAAVSQGDMSTALTCLKAKPQLVNARDKEGRTPLHIAAQKNLRDTALLLLNRGADLTLKDSSGKTAADLAREKGAAATEELLKERASRGSP